MYQSEQSKKLDIEIWKLLGCVKKATKEEFKATHRKLVKQKAIDEIDYWLANKA